MCQVIGTRCEPRVVSFEHFVLMPAKSSDTDIGRKDIVLFSTNYTVKIINRQQ